MCHRGKENKGTASAIIASMCACSCAVLIMLLKAGLWRQPLTWPIPSNPQIWRSKALIKWCIHWPDSSKSWNHVLSILYIWLTDNSWSAWCNLQSHSVWLKQKNPRLWGSFLVMLVVLNIWEKQKDTVEFSVLQDSNRYLWKYFLFFTLLWPKEDYFHWHLKWCIQKSSAPHL